MLLAQKYLILLALSASLFFANAEDPPQYDFQVGDEYMVSMNKSEMSYFKFNLKYIGGYDLSIIADPIGDCDPELFLSTKEHFPHSKETSEYFSLSYGYSSLYIPSASVKTDTDYYLGVLCASEVCDFSLTVTYAQEYYMRPNTSRAIIEYTHEGTLVARVYIPESKQADHIVFAAELQNIDEVDEGLHMYANAGNEIPTSQMHDVVATTAWQDGKAAYIYSGDKYFCTGCNYTLVIQAPKKSKIILTRTVYGEIIHTPLNFERKDAIQRNHHVTYAVNTTRLNPSTPFILVEVKPYFGFFNVSANFAFLPENLTGYQFSMTGHRQEMLWIPVDSSFVNKPLYITVSGLSHATYSLRIYEMGKKNLVLNINEPETSYVAQNTIENFFAIVDGSKNMKMTFALHPEKGHVDLFVKSCAEKLSCNFTKTEVDNILSGATLTSKKDPILQFSNVTDGDEVINIQFDGSACNPSSGSKVPKCYFAIGVLGTSSGTSKFTLTATKVGQHSPLRIGYPTREHLSLDEYKYYFFSVLNDTGIDSVNFQVTKISGDVGIYISRTSKYPDVFTKEKLHHYNDLYSFEKKNFSDLHGTYYVSVKAFSSATYSIMPIVKYNIDNDNIGTHHLVRLVEGIPQKMVLDNNESMYFKFEANFEETDSSNGIEISLNEVQGYFEICVRTDDQLPTPFFCHFSTNSSTLTIPSGSPNYLDTGTYIVAVFPLPSNYTSTKSKTKAQSFSITWAAFHHFRTLVFNVPFANSVSHNRTLYYKFEAHPTEDKEIIIHKTTTSSSNARVDLFLANSQTKFGHNVSNFTYDKASNGSDTIKLNGSDIVSLCSQQGSIYNSNKCYLYIALTTSSEDEVKFYLSLSKDFDDLRLAESVQTYYTFPSKVHPLHLYYYPHHLEDVTILAHTWGRNIMVYANVINTRDHTSRRDWNYPTNRSHEYVSKESASHKGESRLRIPAADLSSCGADYDKFRCGIALTLYYDAPHIATTGTETIYKEYSMFSIIANQEITPIAAGKPVHTSVNENSYRYFNLYVSKEQATLLISASVLSGRHVVILATKGKDARPTLGDAEFMSPYGKMETLEISGEETLQGTAKGDWVIGVYGFSHSEFVLNVVYEKTKMVELHRGLPISIDVYKDPVFFEYYHETDSNFQIKLTRERGAGIISMRKYPEGRMLAGNLPNETNGDVIRHFDSVQTMISVTSTSNVFCRDCLYVIGVFPHKSMKVSVVAQLPGQFIFLQDNMIFTDYAASTIHNKYEHVAWSNRVVDINMVVYSGEPHIFISHNPTVNQSHHIWSYTEASPNNVIRMKLNNTQFTGQHLESIWDGHNIVPSQSSVYFIMVTAPIPSNYSIAISVSNSTRYLIDGHMDFGFLNSGEFNLYKYHVSQDSGSSSTYKLKLQFGMYKDEFSAVRHEKFHAPHITVMSVPQNKKNLTAINYETGMPELPVIEPVRSDVLERGHSNQRYILNLQYLAPADHDFYIIVNNTKSTTHLNYSITANTHEPLYLTMNNMHASRVPVGESDIYAVHANHAGILVIEIHECMGKVVVETSHSRHFVSSVHNAKTATLNNFKPGIDDESFTGQSSVEPDVIPNLVTLVSSSLGSHISLASISIQEEQTVYIIVTGLDGQIDSDVLQDRDAVYKIRTNLHALRNFMPFTNLAPGNDGNLDWDITSDGKLRLGFEDVENLAYMTERVKSTKFGDLDIKYQYDVFFTKDQQASVYLSRCDMLPKSEGVFKGMDRYHEKLFYDQSNVTSDPANPAKKSLEIDMDEDTTTLYATLKITAIGLDSKGKAIWDYPLIYQTAEVKNVTPGGVYSFITFLLGLCMVMLVIALIGLYYYYEKFKRVKAKLNYEMQDIRNIATTVESFDVLDDSINDKKKGGYHGLIEEENV